MAKKGGSTSSANKKITFGADRKTKRTSIGKSRNSKPTNKSAVRERKGR